MNMKNTSIKKMRRSKESFDKFQFTEKFLLIHHRLLFFFFTLRFKLLQNDDRIKKIK